MCAGERQLVRRTSDWRRLGSSFGTVRATSCVVKASGCTCTLTCARTLVCAAHNRCEQGVKPSLLKHTLLRQPGSDPLAFEEMIDMNELENNWTRRDLRRSF